MYTVKEVSKGRFTVFYDNKETMLTIAEGWNCFVVTGSIAFADSKYTGKFVDVEAAISNIRKFFDTNPPIMEDDED